MTRPKQLLLILILGMLGVGWRVTGIEAASTRASQIVHADFDGDGFDDLAVGAPGEDDPNPATAEDAGMVHVVYGGPSGLNPADNEVLHQGLAQVKEQAEPQDMFASAMAAGDFDDDGFDDLAVGVPGETVGIHTGAGAVHVFYGSSDGLRDSGTLDVRDRVFTQNTRFVPDKAESAESCDNDDPPNCRRTGDAFGRSLAAADLDKDGFDDLAVGVPFESIGRQRFAGAINVLYGRGIGLIGGGSRFFHEDSPGVAGITEDEELFGHHLVAGRFGMDRAADLAVGIPFEDRAGNPDTGAVHVFYGDASDGITASGDRVLHQGTPGVPGDGLQGDDLTGWVLAAGDFDGNGFDELAVGAPGEGVAGANGAGAVIVFQGRAGGFGAAGSFWHQGSTGIQEVPEGRDSFGSSLAAGNFGGTGRADLAIGVPDEEVSGMASAGAVAILYGSAVGLTASGNVLFHQDFGGINDAAEEDDRFGQSLAVGDFNDTGTIDLAVGIPQEDIGTTEGGAFAALYGSPTGLTDINDQFIAQTSVGGVAESGDEFGVFFLPACNDPDSRGGIVRP
jgi:hypothetical protein